MSVDKAPPADSWAKATERKYRIDVLATWKALTWLAFPIVFAIVAPWNPGERVAKWFQRGFLQHISWGFTPLFWAAVAVIVATVIYSTVIKWLWDAWDKDVKYPNKKTLNEYQTSLRDERAR